MLNDLNTTNHSSIETILMSQQHGKKNTTPVVSICCITYNHVHFIRQAIESFLMQETSFPVEILIHDDASTDGTAEIIREYEKKHPDLIFPIYQTENQYSKGIKISFTYQFPRARGKYIALCEGDDHWTDPLKLQKQVEFLENDPEFVVCYHDAIMVDQGGNFISPSKMPDEYKRDLTSHELMIGTGFILTLSLCFRNVDILKDFPGEASNIISGDNFLTAVLGQYGKGKYMPDIENAVYRVHSGGVFTSMRQDQTKVDISRINTYYWLFVYFNRIGNKEVAVKYLNKIKNRINQIEGREMPQNPPVNKKQPANIVDRFIRTPIQKINIPLFKKNDKKS